MKPVSKDRCPDGMTLQQWQTALREQAARAGGFSVSELPGRSAPGHYNVSGSGSRRVYRVVYHGCSYSGNRCECMDFRTSRLGTCKHIEAVRLWLESNNRQPAPAPAHRSMLFVDYRGPRRLRLDIGPHAEKELSVAAMRFFDDDLTATPGMIPELPTFIEAARRIDSAFYCMPDALNLILEARDKRRRKELIDAVSDSELDGILHTRLFPYQKEGIRFAFCAGRSLIADEMGLGKTIQAIGTAELLKSRNMIGSVLIVCPTSLKYQWKKEIERFTDSTVTIVEGIHTHRRELYHDDSFYKIVSYHTLANDIKVLGSMSYDLVIMDEVQRLKNWNTQISQAARRLESDYCVVLSGTPLENKLEELYSVMQFVDQYALGPYFEFMHRHVQHSGTGKVTGYRHLNEISSQLSERLIRRRKADVSLQLPERSDQILFVPLTKEQRAIHDEAQSIVAQLVAKWQRFRFLSEKDRKRLLLMLSRMRMVCDSTFVLDQKTRFDTKIAEAVQLISAMIEGGQEKAVVFSQWERMTRIMAEELDKAGITYEYLHGGISSAKRRGLVENFACRPDTRVFLSTDAGATGLNLQAASLIINLDLPWNPAVLEQRISRIYRIGQKRNIHVVNMVAADSIEERLLSTLNFKSGLFAGILDDGADQITLDDSKLNRIAEAVSYIVPPDISASPSGISSAEIVLEEHDDDNDDNSTDADPTPGLNAAEAADIVARGASLMADIAGALRTPEGTARLVDAIVHTDAATGRSELRIPVPDKAAVATLLGALSKLFS